MEEFDIVIIGAGPGGYVAAIRAAQLKFKVAVIEREHLGGICLNWGCIPTKALLKSSEIHHLLNNISDFGFSIENIKFDFNKIIERSRQVSTQLSNGIKHLLKKNKITTIEGEAKLINKSTISVYSKDIEKKINAKNIIIATGAKAKNLPGFETDGNLIWSYKEAMIPKFLPKTILVVGSGAIGIEFASFYQNMGTKVTIIEVADRILMNEDEEIANFAHKSFIKQGMDIFTSTKLVKFVKNDNNVTVCFNNKDSTKEITVDRVIMAVGIIANTENLKLENTKVKLENHHIKTDQYLRTDEENIYAIGDVTGAPWLAHKASHEGIICIDFIAGLNPHPLNVSNVPSCIYARPQIASIGITEKKAIDLGLNINIGRFPFIGNGKAIAIGETEGFIKTIYEKDTGELLGAHMIGSEVTEMIQGYAIAKNLESTEIDMMNTIFPHPTLSEMMHEATLDAYKKAIHI